jgi:uncharacterized protein with PQ loop repeat
MRYGAVNVTTFVLIGFALWVIFTRLRNRADNNWPMVFYPVMVIFAAELPGRVEFNFLVIGLCAALVMRFEFLGGAFAYLVRAIDMLALGAITWNLWDSSI